MITDHVPTLGQQEALFLRRVALLRALKSVELLPAAHGRIEAFDLVRLDGSDRWLYVTGWSTTPLGTGVYYAAPVGRWDAPQIAFQAHQVTEHARLPPPELTLDPFEEVPK